MPPMSTAPADGGPAAHEWAGAHADINLTTVLPRATEKGLQVRTKAATADAVVSMLMGDDVDARKTFIQTNAKDVRFLDI